MIRLGPAGAATVGNIERIKEASRLGLHALEVEFTYGVRMEVKLAKEVGKVAKEEKIELSVHAPYYVNLASLEKEKARVSMKRVIDSCERGHYFAWKGKVPIVFHAAYYMKRDPEVVYDIVRDAILEMQEVIEEKKWKVVLCPETTGKKTQFGDIDELLRLSKETGCGLCVDFAHLLAREGKIDYDSVMKKLKGLKHVHAHFSGIEYGPKGERRHKLTAVKDMKELVKYLKKYKIDVTIINESPDPFGDSVKMAKLV